VDRLVDAGTDLVKIYTRVDRTLIGPLVDEARTSTSPSPATSASPTRRRRPGWD
jgi:hypothetical protein